MFDHHVCGRGRGHCSLALVCAEQDYFRGIVAAGSFAGLGWSKPRMWRSKSSNFLQASASKTALLLRVTVDACFFYACAMGNRCMCRPDSLQLAALLHVQLWRMDWARCAARDQLGVTRLGVGSEVGCLRLKVCFSDWT